MIIAVASGKGGTGKTTVAVSLALSLENVQYIDCDVEEPNASIFLKPEFHKKNNVSMLVPLIDENRCSVCGECSKLCAFNALVNLGKRILVFPQLCHSCGGCSLICPEKAITEQPRTVGVIERGTAHSIDFIQGTLNISEPMAPPIIKELIKLVDKNRTVILDSPPGTSCPVIETVRECDFCILVTEPTPFGLNDLKLAVETVRKLGIPSGVIINSHGVGNDEVEKYCSDEQIPVLMKIPWSRKIAEHYSRGEPAVVAMPELKDKFQEMIFKIRGLL